MRNKEEVDILYFVDLKYVEDNKENNSTNYLEFTKEPFDEFKAWKEDSLYIYGGIFDELEFNKLFRSVVSNFDFYDNTKVTKDDWDKLYEKSRSMDLRVVAAFDELKIWVDEYFNEYDYFVIRGI